MREIFQISVVVGFISVDEDGHHPTSSGEKVPKVTIFWPLLPDTLASTQL